MKTLAGWLFCLSLFGLAACNGGSAVVTLTGTQSTDNFLAYRVGLASAQLNSASGGTPLKLLPSTTTVDFATLTNVSEVLGVSTATKGTYTSASVTLDYTAAQIVYDDGTVNGLLLTPVDASGAPITQVTVSLSLDPADLLKVSTNSTNRLALDFKMAASNVVNVAAKTVTVTPMITATSSTNDTKAVRVRGTVASSNATTNTYTTTIIPFNGNVVAAGQLEITPADSTSYEVNGVPASGTGGLTAIAAAGKNAVVVTYGTLASTTATTAAAAEQTLTTTTDNNVSLFGTTTTPAETVSSTPTSLFKSSVPALVTFNATQVFGGSSVQGISGSELDRVSGIVTSRSANTLNIQDGTALAADGTETFLQGTTIIQMGPNTAVTTFGQSSSVAGIESLQQVSVGTTIDAFGVITNSTGTTATMDATTGRVRIDSTYASGLVTSLSSSELIMNLVTLNNRSLAAFDFLGTGTSATADATQGQYTASTASSDLSNLAAGSSVILQGAPNAFSAAPPDFTAASLLDPTTILAQLVVDWGAGTAAPFSAISSTGIDVDRHNTSIGARHEIQLGAAVTDILGMAADPIMTANSAAASTTATVYAIGHLPPGQAESVENFNSFADFATSLQTYLNKGRVALNVTAVGQYTASASTLAASSITVFLND
jgi:hypothetical protein